MNIDELFRLTKWVTREVKGQKIPEKYQQLQTILERNSQPNQQKVSFETQQEELLDALRSVNFDLLTKEQISFLNDIRIGELIGGVGADYLEEILFRNQLDIAAASAKIKKIIQDLNDGIQKLDQIENGLSGCIDDEEYDFEDEVLIRVCFFGDAEISNIRDFKNWGNAWHEIGRGIAMAHGATPEDIRVVGAAKGSVIIELMACAAISATVSKIILDALKVVEKVMNIRKIAIDSKHTQLLSKKLEQQLEKEAEETKEKGASEIIKNQIKELKLNKDSDGEKINALEKAITNLVNFIEKGGELDFVIPEEDEIEDEDEENENKQKQPSPYSQLRNDFENIKKIEHKIKLLENNLQEEEAE